MTRRLKLVDGSGLGGARPDTEAGDEGNDGFSLRFVRGRGVVSLADARPFEAVTVGSLEMLIPRIAFPFDVSAGVRGLRNRRLELNRLSVTIGLDGLVEVVRARLSRLEWVSNPRLTIERDCLCVLVDFGPPGSRIPFGFRLLPSVGEATLSLLIDEIRAYGPAPMPLLVMALSVIGETAIGRLDGVDLVLPDPVKAVTMRLLPPRGWRLPDGTGAALLSLELNPDRAVLEFGPTVDQGEKPASSDVGMARRRRLEELRLTRAGDLALSKGDLGDARGIYYHTLGRDPDCAVAAARLAMLDVADQGARDTGRALLAEAIAKHPKRTDLRAVQAHACALDEDIDGEVEALGVLFEAAYPLERLAAGLRIGHLLKDRDPDAAIRVLEGALAARREDPQSLLSLIEIGADMGRHDLVDRLVPRWIAVHRSPAERAFAHLRVAEILLDGMKDAARAVKNFERAALADPSDERAAWGLARALAALGDHERAISRFERLGKLCARRDDRGGSARAAESIGDIWLARGDPDLAAARFEEAIAADRPSSGRLAKLSKARAMLGMHAEAAVALERAMAAGDWEADSAERAAHALELAEIYLDRLGDFAAAEPWIHAAARDDRGGTRAAAMMARLLERQGDFGGLTRVLERTLASSPSVDNVVALSHARLKAGEFQAALSTLDGALAANPGRLDLLDLLIEASRGAGDRTRLYEALKQRFTTCDDPPRRALIASEVGALELVAYQNPKHAAAWFRRALDEDPASLEAQSGLIDALRRLGEDAEIETNLEILAEKLRRAGRRTEAAGVTAKRAKMISARGDYETAAALWREALPDLSEKERVGALLEMAEVFLAAGDFTAALDLFKAARAEARPEERYEAALGVAEASSRIGDHECAYEAAIAAGSGPYELRSKAARAAATALVHLSRGREAARILERVAENVEEAEAVELLLIAARILREDVGDPARAQGLIERLLEIDPRHERGKAALIELLEGSGDRTALAMGLARFAGEDEAGVADLKRAADFFSAEGLHEDAAGALRTALDITRDGETARMLAGALKRCGADEEMLEVLREFASEDEQVRALLLDQLEEIGRYEDLARLLAGRREQDKRREVDRLVRLARIRSKRLRDPAGAIEDLLAAMALCEDLAEREGLAALAVDIARELGDARILARCLEQQAGVLGPEHRPRVLFELAGTLCAIGDEDGARNALRRGREGGRGRLEWMVDAARRHPTCGMLAAGAADEAARLESWKIAEEMLGLSISCAQGAERVKLLRNRAAVRRGRLGDKRGAARDLLEVRECGFALPAPELEDLVDLLEIERDSSTAARVALELAQGAGWEIGRVTRAARLFEEAGDRDQARDLWRKAVSTNADPGSIVALLKLLEPERDGGEIDGLLALMKGREGLLDIPEHLALLEVVVNLDLVRGQDLEAVEGLAAMVDLDPGRADPWRRMVQILERRGEWEALVRRMEERLTYTVSTDDIARTAMAMGRILEEKLGDEDGAVAAFERVIAVLPAHLGANTALAQIAYRRRRWDLMERYLAAADGVESSAEVELWRAVAADSLGRTDEALARYRALIEHVGPTSQCVEGIARLAVGPEADDEIIELGRRLVEAVGQDNVKSHVHRRLGLAHKRKGNKDEARRALERADKISGGDPDTLEVLAELYGELEHYQEQAEVLCRLAYAVDGPPRARYLVRAAKIYAERLYEVTRAFHWLQRAADISPDDPDVLLGLADCAWILGEKVIVARSLERFRLVAPGIPIGASRTFHLAAALAHTREWPVADVIEMLEQALGRLGEEERRQGEELMEELRATAKGAR